MRFVWLLLVCACSATPPPAPAPAPPAPIAEDAPEPSLEDADAKVLAGYQKFTSEGGYYEVMLPAPPEEQYTETERNKVPMHMATLEHGDAVFIVTWAEMPATDFDSAAALQGGVSSLDNSLDPGTVESTPVKVQGHDGFDSRGMKNGAPFFCRMFIVNTRLYQIMAIGKPEAEAQAFIRSFHLTGEPPRPLR
jgi:hypothetical protein